MTDMRSALKAAVEKHCHCDTRWPATARLDDSHVDAFAADVRAALAAPGEPVAAEKLGWLICEAAQGGGEGKCDPKNCVCHGEAERLQAVFAKHGMTLFASPRALDVEAIEQELAVHFLMADADDSSDDWARNAAAPGPPAEDAALPLPQSLHWLGDREAADEFRHATDMRGCVMYFERQSDCLQFMRWLTERAAPPTLSRQSQE